MAAGLKVWRDSQWMGALAMGSVKREVLLGVMTGALVGRVKGPSCQLDEVGLAAARRAMLRVTVVARRRLRIRIRMQVCIRRVVRGQRSAVVLRTMSHTSESMCGAPGIWLTSTEIQLRIPKKVLGVCLSEMSRRFNMKRLVWITSSN